MLKDSEYVLKENDQYEGFCVDLLKEIAELVGFKYKIELVADGNYGAPDKSTGTWNGMVREIIDRVRNYKMTKIETRYTVKSLV